MNALQIIGLVVLLLVLVVHPDDGRHGPAPDDEATD